MSTITSTSGKEWEIVSGLEVHCELATATKLFCGCANEFGAEPNTHVCPVCLGLPGSLPVLNEHAVEFALRVGEAFGFDVPPQSIFHRKNYFYPDMPKNFQTTQYDEPICVHGSLVVDGERIGITRAHLEEDTGKSTHVGGAGGRIHGASHSLVDYNRAGVPLLEIVSEPDIRSAEQAAAYVDELRATLKAIGVSDVKMEEGSLRVDANVSVRPVGSSAVRHALRDQEPQLVEVAARRDRLRGPAPDRAARSGRAGRAGDAPVEREPRPHRVDALEGRGVRLPLLPRARSRARRARRRAARPRARVDARAAGRAAVAARSTSGGSARPRRTRSSTSTVSPTTPRP